MSNTQSQILVERIVKLKAQAQRATDLANRAERFQDTWSEQEYARQCLNRAAILEQQLAKLN